MSTAAGNALDCSITLTVQADVDEKDAVKLASVAYAQSVRIPSPSKLQLQAAETMTEGAMLRLKEIEATINANFFIIRFPSRLVWKLLKQLMPGRIACKDMVVINWLEQEYTSPCSFRMCSGQR
eukprot:753966-Hanusia_phi.AAC.6